MRHARSAIVNEQVLTVVAATILLLWGLFALLGKRVYMEGTDTYLEAGCSRVIGAVAILASIIILCLCLH